MELGYGFPVLAPTPTIITFTGKNTDFVVTATPTSNVNVAFGDIVHIYYSINCLRNGADAYIRGNIALFGTAVLESTGLSGNGLPFTVNVLALSAGDSIGESHSTARLVTSAGTITSARCTAYGSAGTLPVNIFSHLRVVIILRNL